MTTTSQFGLLLDPVLWRDCMEFVDLEFNLCGTRDLKYRTAYVRRTPISSGKMYMTSVSWKT
jgi:hypothetical protein